MKEVTYSNKERIKLLKKGIKQMKSVICAFNYKYFVSLDNLSDEGLKRFDEFRNDTLFKLVDQWKKMELELMGEKGVL